MSRRGRGRGSENFKQTSFTLSAEPDTGSPSHDPEITT